MIVALGESWIEEEISRPKMTKGWDEQSIDGSRCEKGYVWTGKKEVLGAQSSEWIDKMQSVW